MSNLRVPGIAWSLNYYRDCLSVFNDGLPKGIGSHERSLKLFEQINDKKGIATNLDNLGVVYENMGDLPKTLKYFQQAVGINEKIDTKRAWQPTLLTMGIFYDDLSDIPRLLSTDKNH